jgi:hypothetical protein
MPISLNVNFTISSSAIAPKACFAIAQSRPIRLHKCLTTPQDPAVGALAELFADKVMWLDSAWDAVHTFVRPIGGALLALAIIDPSDPATQVIAFLLGGGASFLAHGGKASARAVVNTSPEPVSNILVSSAEDVATVGLLWLIYEYPLAAGAVAAVLLLIVIALLWTAHKIIKRVFFRGPKPQG